jgi:hypothetical protein
LGDGELEGGSRNGGIQHSAGEFTKQAHLFVGRLGYHLAKVLQVLPGTGVGLGQAAIEHLDDLISHIGEGLKGEGHEHWVV